MEHLVRSRVDRFKVEDSITLSQIEEFRDNGTLKDYIVPADEMLDMYSKCMVSESAEN